MSSLKSATGGEILLKTWYVCSCPVNLGNTFAEDPQASHLVDKISTDFLEFCLFKPMDNLIHYFKCQLCVSSQYIPGKEYHTVHKFFSTFHFVSVQYLRTVSLNSQLKHRLQQQKIQWSAFPEVFSLLLQMKSSLDGKVIFFSQMHFIVSNVIYIKQGVSFIHL